MSSGPASELQRSIHTNIFLINVSHENICCGYICFCAEKKNINSFLFQAMPVCLHRIFPVNYFISNIRVKKTKTFVNLSRQIQQTTS